MHSSSERHRSELGHAEHGASPLWRSPRLPATHNNQPSLLGGARLRRGIHSAHPPTPSSQGRASLRWGIHFAHPRTHNTSQCILNAELKLILMGNLAASLLIASFGVAFKVAFEKTAAAVVVVVVVVVAAFAFTSIASSE
ncbi:hypothetical protein EJ08DRAFT_658905 [Tothia fuscella]|uniref:Uncharacterized protein n=1 Tax=Tothia fuscella TaxID=1048955 RepID=A0A9P4U0L1_9PEZI|nr:hypothetical protein EJ08DRAFT_658905 [Tothia fuscella]